jgi:hypothetical protein
VELILTEFLFLTELFFSLTEPTELTEDAVAFFALRLKTVGSPAENTLSIMIVSAPTATGITCCSIRSVWVVATGLAEQQLHKQKEKIEQTKQIKHFFISIKNQRSS